MSHKISITGSTDPASWQALEQHLDAMRQAYRSAVMPFSDTPPPGLSAFGLKERAAAFGSMLEGMRSRATLRTMRRTPLPRGPHGTLWGMVAQIGSQTVVDTLRAERRAARKRRAARERKARRGWGGR